MKNYEIINAQLDENNLNEEGLQEELAIMLSADEYNDANYFASLEAYNNLDSIDEELIED